MSNRNVNVVTADKGRALLQMPSIVSWKIIKQHALFDNFKMYARFLKCTCERMFYDNYVNKYSASSRHNRFFHRYSQGLLENFKTDFTD